MSLQKAIVVEDSAFFRKGQIVEVERSDEGVLTESGQFIHGESVIVLDEALSLKDETRVRELIRQALKQLMWNMYTKSSNIVP